MASIILLMVLSLLRRLQRFGSPLWYLVSVGKGIEGEGGRGGVDRAGYEKLGMGRVGVGGRGGADRTGYEKLGMGVWGREGRGR